MIDPGEPAQPRLAQQRHVDREGQRAQPRVGADVAGRLLATDMLLARRQRQHETAAPIGVDRLAAQPAGHLADVFVLAAEQPDIRPSELEPDAERLPLADDDVRAHLARRELDVMLRELLTRLPDIEASGEPDRLRSSFINGIKHLECRYSPR